MQPVVLLVPKFEEAILETGSLRIVVFVDFNYGVLAGARRHVGEVEIACNVIGINGMLSRDIGVSTKNHEHKLP